MELKHAQGPGGNVVRMEIFYDLYKSPSDANVNVVIYSPGHHFTKAFRR